MKPAGTGLLVDGALDGAEHLGDGLPLVDRRELGEQALKPLVQQARCVVSSDHPSRIPV
jgi:hypothetical protein